MDTTGAVRCSNRPTEFSAALLLNQLENKSAVPLSAKCGHKISNCVRSPALPTEHFSEVIASYFHLNHRGLSPGHFTDLHTIWRIDQRPNHFPHHLANIGLS